MVMQLDDWLESIEQAENKELCWQQIVSAFDSYGFDRVIFLHGDARHHIDVKSNFDASWGAHYIEQGFLSRDPFIQYCASTYQMVRTGLAHVKEHPYLEKPEIQVIEEASDAGFNSGFSCTIERFLGHRAAAWNIGSRLKKSEVDSLLETHLADLQQLCHRAQRVLQRQSVVPLTERENQILQGLAEGLRYKQIAEKLNITTSTVEFHLRNLRKKLSAKTTEQAIAIASANQLGY